MSLYNSIHGKEINGDTADVLTLLGSLYMQMHDFERAETFIRKAASICAELYGDDKNTLAAVLNLASTLSTRKKWKDALAMMHNAQRIAEALGDPLEIALTRMNTPIVLMELQKNEEAVQVYDAILPTIELFAESGLVNPKKLMEMLFRYSNALVRVGRTDDAQRVTERLNTMMGLSR